MIALSLRNAWKFSSSIKAVDSLSLLACVSCGFCSWSDFYQISSFHKDNFFFSYADVPRLEAWITRFRRLTLSWSGILFFCFSSFSEFWIARLTSSIFVFHSENTPCPLKLVIFDHSLKDLIVGQSDLSSDAGECW